VWTPRRNPDLVFSGAYTWPYKRVGAEIALNVGGDDFSSDAIALHEPLVCPRHGDRNLWWRMTKRKTTLMSVPGKAKLYELVGGKEGL
jgi:hypothetical protein